MPGLVHDKLRGVQLWKTSEKRCSCCTCSISSVSRTRCRALKTHLLLHIFNERNELQGVPVLVLAVGLVHDTEREVLAEEGSLHE